MTNEFVQNSDRNISHAYYGLMAKDQLLVTKIFLTHQGEGPYAGRLAIFLRLAGCNRGSKIDMGCRFCDTDFRFDQGKPMHFHEIRHEIMALTEGKIWVEWPILVVTGGEPMMQDNLAYFLDYALNDLQIPIVQIESNGDRLISNFPDKVKLVISPKVGREGYRPIKPEIWARANAVKFLIDADPESPYYNVPEWNLFVSPVLLSPITHYKAKPVAGIPASAWDGDIVDHARTSANYRRAAQIARERGFRLSMQTHLFFQEE